jgi:uridine phosphorylase
VLAVSTGIGGASAGIAVEELHNIGVNAMIRVGSCGALQPKVKLGDIIIVNGAVKDDGASKTYSQAILPAVPNAELMIACIEAAKTLGCPYHVGIARSHDSFYTDQEVEIDAYWSRQGVLGADMETAALFTIAHLRGVKAASILNNVVAYEEDTAEAIGSYVDGEDLSMKGERNEILTALEALYRVWVSR